MLNAFWKICSHTCGSGGAKENVDHSRSVKGFPVNKSNKETNQPWLDFNLSLVEEGVAEKVVISQSGRHLLHFSESY